VVEGAALEMLFRGNFNEGSNPSLSVQLESNSIHVRPLHPYPERFTGVLESMVVQGSPVTSTYQRGHNWGHSVY
jgi:hypothetical protein